MSIQVIFPGFGDNQKTRSVVWQIRNECLKNYSNNFLRTHYIITFSHAFQNVLLVYYRKIRGSPKLAAQFIGSACLEKTT